MAKAARLEEFLPGDVLQALDATGRVDAVLGIVASNHARSVVHVVERGSRGLAKHFPGQKAVVLVADAGSGDGTLEAVRAWQEGAPSLPHVLLAPIAGPPVEGRAIHAILGAAKVLEARACSLLDADLIGLTPDWVERLLQPVFRGEADYVSPAYTRTPVEGTLTTNLLAPLTRALYGRRIQQILGGCLTLSQAAVRRLLEADVWESDLAVRGIRLWMSTAALGSDDCRLVEVSLGRKLVAPAVQAPDLATTLAHVVGPLFTLMERYAPLWRDTRGSRPIPRVGEPPELLGDMGEVHLDRMVRAFKLGLKDLLPVWEQILTDETLAQCYPLALQAADEFQFPPPLWARTISDFALAYHERRLPRDHLLRALTPLYLGRVAAFLLEAQIAPPHRLPEMLEVIGRAFESEMESLRTRWR